MVSVGSCRFTILTPRLIRMEYDPRGIFEDRPSRIFWHRNLPAAAYKTRQTGGILEITTEFLRLTYKPNPRGFTPETLSVRILPSDIEWRYGDADPFNLRGTYRTLDGRDGPVPIPPGLMSQSGWCVVDDSGTLVFDKNGWFAPRFEPGISMEYKKEIKDLYFFGYGRAYGECLRDFCRIAGTVPLIPRWVLGNWWSRYWAYSQDELREVVEGFRRNGIPLSVCIIDMDWHLVENPHTSGWTGYTWNRKLFPEPEKFLGWLHEQGLKIALNLHPHDGIHPHESAYAEIASELEIDPKSKQPVKFEIADPKFACAYLTKLHHPLERQGVDFWWMDWQQGTKSGLEGLDPLFVLNHLHFYDLGRDGHKRSMIFSRWSELGSHRYPIGFSGDTHVTWKSLAFQPYFTATAANTGYFYWSHDIGGHCMGYEEPELYTRWIQFGVFSPVLRIHSTKCKFQDRRPWMQDGEILRIIGDFMRLRHALIPYLYSMCRRASKTSVPPIRPMYYEYPDRDEAYVCDDQYFFGSEMIVAPYTAPLDPDTRLARQTIWLPPGDWYNFFTGEHIPGDRFYASYGKLDEIPVYAKAGAIIPMGPKAGWNNVANPETLEVQVFIGADNCVELYEDDGQTSQYLKGAYCITKMRQETGKNKLNFIIEPAQGQISLIPAKRSWRFVFTGVTSPGAIACTAGDKILFPQWEYDKELERLKVSLDKIDPREKIEISLQSKGTLLSRRDRKPEILEKMLFSFHTRLEAKNTAAEMLEKSGADPDTLFAIAGQFTSNQLRAWCESLYGAGFGYLGLQSGRRALALWNNSGSPHIKYCITGLWGSYTGQGTVPGQLLLQAERNEFQEKEKPYLNDTWNGVMSYGGITLNLKDKKPW